MECKICDCKSQFQLCISGKKSNSAYHKVVCVIFLTKNELVGTNKKTIICCFLLPVWPASVRARKLDFPLWLSGTRNGKKYIRDFTAALLYRVHVLAQKIFSRLPAGVKLREIHHCASTIESVQDFLIKFDTKPCMHLVKISIFH